VPACIEEGEKMSQITINFYGADRFTRLGKHPSEFMASDETFNSYAEAQERASILAKTWGMAVEGYEPYEKERAIYADFVGDDPASDDDDDGWFHMYQD